MNRKSDLSRDKILKAARNIVAKQGIQDATLQAIADGAGISKGSLYYYYRSKDDILYDIMEQDNAESMKMAGRVDRDFFDKEKIIKDIISGTMDRIASKDKNSISVHLQGEALRGNRTLMKKYRAKYTEWAGDVEKVIMAIHGIESCALTRTYAALFLAAVDGLCMQRLLLGRILADEDLLRTLGSMLLHVHIDPGLTEMTE